MNYIFTGDWHQCIKTSIPRQWAVNRYRELHQVILDACREYQADLFLTGDLLDNSRPNLDEWGLIVEFLSKIKRAQIRTYLISGNHSEISNQESVFDYLKPELISDGWVLSGDNDLHIEPNLSFYLRNHNTIKAEGVTDIETKVDRLSILVSHFRCTLGAFIQEEVPVKQVCSKFDLVLAGDIHAEHSVGNLHYTNSPLNCNFESNPCGSFIVLSVDSKTKDYEIQRIKTDLPQLIRKDCTAGEFESLTSALDPRHYYKISVSGSAKELRQIPNSLPFATIEKEAEVDVVFDKSIESEEPEETKAIELSVEDELIEYAAKVGIGEERLVKLAGILRES
jgi:hypothetical protein